MFEDVTALEEDGFEALRPGQYARPIDPDFFHVLKLQRLKGGSSSVYWGLALTYLPHVQGHRIRWRRTLKSLRLDLFEEPVIFFHLYDRPWPEGSEYFAQNGHGPRYLAKTMNRMWSSMEQPVRSWFASTSDLDGILRKAEIQLTRDWHGVGHNPDPQLVHAFTLGRLGRRDEAARSLEQYLAPGGESTDAEVLRNALSRAS